MINKIKKIAPLLFVTILVMNAYVWVEYFRPRDNNLHFYMLDVGQGDALFAHTPYDQDILIDGGPGKAVLGELGKTMPFYDRYIDLVILTHPHKDHIEGLISVLERYEVGRVIITGVNYESADYEEFLDLVEEKEVPITIAKKGQLVEFGVDLSLSVLAPNDQNGSDIENLNNSSIIALLKFGDFEIILPGDAEVEEWGEVLKASTSISAEVLKTAHHGSVNGTTREVLDRVKPEVILISSGEKNSYGHPHEEVLSLAKEFGSKIFRTDEKGTVEIVSDGRGYKVK